MFVNEPFVKCELKFFVVFTDRVEVEGIETIIQQLACVNQKKKIMNRTKRLCSLYFSKISSFQCYNDFYLEHDRFDKLSELLKVVGFFLFFFCLVLFCYCYLGF